MNNNEPKKSKYIFSNIYVRIIAILFIITMIFNINNSIIIVSGSSMNPNYENGDILLSKKHFNLDRFDVVISYIEESEDKLLIKRVIGLPGEYIEYKDNKLYVNGIQLEDKFGMGYTNYFSIQLDNDEYLCLGDNREHSSDSRVYGPFKQKYIIGKVVK